MYRRTWEILNDAFLDRAEWENMYYRLSPHFHTYRDGLDMKIREMRETLSGIALTKWKQVQAGIMLDSSELLQTGTDMVGTGMSLHGLTAVDNEMKQFVRQFEERVFVPDIGPAVVLDQ